MMGPCCHATMPLAVQLAIQYAATYHLSTGDTTCVLADSFLKGLLAAHHDTEGSIRDAWSAAGFREACEVGAHCSWHMPLCPPRGNR